MKLRVVALETIIVPDDRDRSEIDPKALRELAWSIEARGLLQPPGVFTTFSPEGATNSETLVWGERRLRAVMLLASEGKAIKSASGVAVPLGFIPVLDFDSLASEVEKRSAELEENTHRVELSWPDRARALARIHALRVSLSPATTIADTAKEIAQRTGASPESLRTAPSGAAAANNLSIPLAIHLAPHLNDPEVKRANTPQAAFAIVRRREEEAATAELVRRRLSTSDTSAPIRFLLGDAQDLFRDVPANSVDLIFTDPPYGINADSSNFSKRQAQKHFYSDSPEDFRKLVTWLFEESFRVAKDRANLFMFFDSKHLGFIYDQARAMAWSPFPSPLIWDKVSPGIGPWHTEGFQRTYEMLFFATKGRKGLLSPAPDLLRHKRVPTDERRHAAQKPESLIRQVIELCTFPGDLILDPFAGSGSTLVSARLTNRRALGFELDPLLYDAGIANVFGEDALTSPAPVKEPAI